VIYIMGSLIPFAYSGNWTSNNAMITIGRTIQDIYPISTSDDDIKNDLIERARITCESGGLMIDEYIPVEPLVWD